MTLYEDLHPSVIRVGPKVAYSWQCQLHHDHSIQCLWVWHYCDLILSPESVAPGQKFGWRPGGVGLHTLVQQEPLTITASVIWPCCGLHGFITDGEWVDA